MSQISEEILNVHETAANEDYANTQCEPENSKETVSRRISSHTLRHRSNEVRYIPESKTGRIGQGQAWPANMPVIEFPSLPRFQKHVGQEGAAYQLLKDQSVDLSEETSCITTSGANKNIKLEVALGLLHDSTMAVQVALSQSLLQWPYFHDLSLVSHYLI